MEKQRKALPMLNGFEPTCDAPSYKVSDSGTFSKEDWQVKGTGIHHTPAGQGRISDLNLADLQVDGQPLGTGASGSVRKAVHAASGRVLALKTINIADKSKRDQFMTELKILTGAQAVCSNLLHFYDAFYMEPCIHLAIEFMDAGSLDQVLATRAQASEEVVACILRQVLLGLHFLHKERRNLHRDLKPGNILLNSAGVVKVADFGISRQMEDTVAVAATFTGTAVYMSPERMQGQPYSFPSDIWAVGIIGTECVIGRYPYPLKKDMTYFAMISCICSQPPPLPGPEYSPLLNSLLAACLQKEPSKRSDCEQLLLHQFLLPGGGIRSDATGPETAVAEWLTTRRA